MEYNAFCQEVLKARMADGALDKAAVHGDVCSYEVDGEALRAEILLAGWPCQACRPFCLKKRVASFDSHLIPGRA